jgi:hypothetical protein
MIAKLSFQGLVIKFIKQIFGASSKIGRENFLVTPKLFDEFYYQPLKAESGNHFDCKISKKEQ